MLHVQGVSTASHAVGLKVSHTCLFSLADSLHFSGFMDPHHSWNGGQGECFSKAGLGVIDWTMIERPGIERLHTKSL